MDFTILYKKLHLMGFRGLVLSLLQSYLMCVLMSLNGGETATLDWKAIKKGVPQDSVMGPLLFLLYINDISRATPHSMTLFADDPRVIIKDRDKNILQRETEVTLEQLNAWLENRGVILNIRKTNL